MRTEKCHSRKDGTVVAKQYFFQYWQNYCLVQLNLLGCIRKYFVVGESLG